VIERAKHGKRPQRYDGATPPVTLAEIVLGLQELGIRYFDVHPYMEDGKPLPNDYRTEIHATLPPERRAQLLSQFSTVERTCLDDIDNIVRHLGIPEIRALGTHEDLQETMGDIELEFDHIIARLVPRAVTTIEAGSPFLGVAQDMLEYASEAHKKSCTERKKDYESAYDQFQNDIKDPLLREGFGKCQARGAQIWDAPQMEALARRAKLAWAIAKTLAAVAYFGDHPEDRDQQRSAKAREMKHVWDEGISGLREHRVSGLPSDLGDVYVGGNHQLTPVVRERLLEMVGLLKR
jgi:hypothetical protein